MVHYVLLTLPATSQLPVSLRAARLPATPRPPRCTCSAVPTPTRLLPTLPQSLAIAEPLSGPTLGRYRDLAAATGLWVSVGGFQERGPDPEHLYNTHVVIDGTGKIVASYSKIHLFNVDVPGGPVLMESRWVLQGGACLVYRPGWLQAGNPRQAAIQLPSTSQLPPGVLQALVMCLHCCRMLYGLRYVAYCSTTMSALGTGLLRRGTGWLRVTAQQAGWA